MSVNRVYRHLKDGVTHVKYHGSDRPKAFNTVADSDIVVTTYSTLTTEFQSMSTRSLLHSIDWYRIVLDEGKPRLPLSFRELLPCITAINSTHHSPPRYSILSCLRRASRQLAMVSHGDPYSEQARRHWHPTRVHPRRAFLHARCLSEMDRVAL